MQPYCLDRAAYTDNKDLCVKATLLLFLTIEANYTYIEDESKINKMKLKSWFFILFFFSYDNKAKVTSPWILARICISTSKFKSSLNRIDFLYSSFFV